MEAANRRLREDTAQLRRERLRVVTSNAASAGPRPLHERLEEVEGWFVEAALAHFAGDVGAAARRLGVSVRGMRDLMRRHGVDESGLDE